MVRSIISILVSIGIIIFASIYEQAFLNKTFNELSEMLSTIHLKIEDKTAVSDDIVAVQNFWISKKRKLHIFIPHTEIKEVDLWISECITYVKYSKFDDAEAKIEVVEELCQQIPKTFFMRIENLF